MTFLKCSYTRYEYNHNKEERYIKKLEKSIKIFKAADKSLFYSPIFEFT